MKLSELSLALKHEIAYPPQMLFIETGILGHGFYPGCLGFSQKSPQDGVLLLGRDFGTKSYYEALSGLPTRDEFALTWRHTRDIYLAGLTDLPIWCTNYLMGVRVDGSAKGDVKERISSTDWEKYERSCWRFLQRQVLLQRPRVIVVFGKFNRIDLAVDERLGRGQARDFSKTFELDGTCHTAIVTFADHPHSLIRTTAKDIARTDVKRIGELYRSAPV